MKISLAGKDMSISGYKSYFIKDETGAIPKCTTTSKAFFVPDLQHDLLGGRALVTANYHLILDKDPKISGLFSVTNGKIDPANGLLFLDLEGLFFVETVPLSETQFKKYVRISSVASVTQSLSYADNPRYDTTCKGN